MKGTIQVEGNAVLKSTNVTSWGMFRPTALVTSWCVADRESEAFKLVQGGAGLIGLPTSKGESSSTTRVVLRWAIGLVA